MNSKLISGYCKGKKIKIDNFNSYLKETELPVRSKKNPIFLKSNVNLLNHYKLLLSDHDNWEELQYIPTLFEPEIYHHRQNHNDF